MKPVEIIKRVIVELEKVECEYALAGGFAASLYRKQPRLTNDVDFVFSAGSINNTKKKAIAIIEKIGAKAHNGWIPQLKERNINTMPLIIGQFNNNDYEATVDFLLPIFPWVTNALKRSKNHIIDFGFANIPTLTVEDIIISKVFALNIEPNRFQDLDDLKAIFNNEKNLDIAYLLGQLEILSIKIPSILSENIPISLKL